MKHSLRIVAIAALVLVIGLSCGHPAATLAQSPLIGGCPIFPANNIWNTPIDTLPVDARSAAYVSSIGANTAFHPDFGANLGGGAFGIPYVVVPDSQARVPVAFDYADESDAGPYPIPSNPPIEPGGGDNHILMITRDEHKLYELYAVRQTAGGAWEAGSGAIFDLLNGTQRPAGWTEQRDRGRLRCPTPLRRSSHIPALRPSSISALLDDAKISIERAYTGWPDPSVPDRSPRHSPLQEQARPLRLPRHRPRPSRQNASLRPVAAGR